MPAERNLPTPEAEEIVGLARSVAREQLAPRAAGAEEDAAFPRDVFRTLGELGFLGMPYPEEVGGAGQPYEVYLQALEEISAAWASVGVGLSVHVMSCYPLASFGTTEQRDALAAARCWPATCSAATASPRPTRARIRARCAPGRRRYLTTRRAVLTRLPAGASPAPRPGSPTAARPTSTRSSPAPRRSARAGSPASSSPAMPPASRAGPPERKMGLTGSTTATLDYDAVELGADRLIGGEGAGLAIALQALDSGRLGIAAVATGLAQGSLDLAVDYAKERETFGRPIIEHQGLGFLLADMAAAVESARAVTLEAARRRDRGLPFARQASIAKLVATDAAMKVTTDAVQVLGGFGYTKEFPVERHMREAKVMQIFEGTNQIQRLVIARHLARQG